MHPRVESLIIPITADAEIVVGRPQTLNNNEEIEVTHSIHVSYDGLESVTMLESGYQDINIHKYVLRQYIK